MLQQNLTNIVLDWYLVENCFTNVFSECWKCHFTDLDLKKISGRASPPDPSRSLVPTTLDVYTRTNFREAGRGGGGAIIEITLRGDKFNTGPP